MTDILLASAFLAACCLLLLLKKFLRPITLSDIRGPPSPSFVLGHEYEFRNQDEAGDFNLKFLEEYGTVWKMKTCFDIDNLMVADPLALQHILHTSGYSYPKRVDVNHSAKLVVGDGIVVAIGDAHSRQRKAMNPAFSASQLRTMLPVFQRSVDHLCRKLKVEAEKVKGESHINLSSLLARTTLDVIGRAALDYEFNALDEADGPFVKAFKNLLYPYFPQRLLNLVQYMPTREYTRFRHFVELAKNTAREHIKEKADVILMEDEKENKDVLSLLVRANKDEEAKHKMNDDEILCQMSTIILAGHDTTANTMAWTLYELSKHQDVQTALRDEIMDARKEHGIADDDPLSTQMLDALPLLNAVIKETSRMHPIVPNLAREAGKDDVIPLSYPVQTRSGEWVNSVTVKKGQAIGISICAYNRIRAVWGDDANEWNPDRWMKDGVRHDTVNLGVHANLLTFSAGLRACIGLIELQVLMFQLISRFEFAPPPEKYDVMRAAAGLMVPIIRGKMEMGVNMPLSVTPINGDIVGVI
ncbi:cytochrome P450 [Pterulicium gracile]|uniref:Cytochrome P450 n=1 Tax=Pterulicium gracile TaxID=1884261 RepID=A0A5C3Q577_9AGAR|nr:cytochrome P450 [Pterula gracilis]